MIATAPADAASTWLAPADLSVAGQDVLAPQVDVDAQGNAVAVWARSNGANMIVQGAVRPAGGAWQAPVDLSAGGTDAVHQQITVDSQGNAIAIWNRGGYVQAAERPVGGTWQAPRNLSLIGGSATVPQVSVDPQGNAIAVWERGNGANQIIQAASRPAGGTWTTPVDVSVAGRDANTPQVALDPQGDAVAVWSRFDGTHTITQAALHAPGGAWQTPVDLSAVGQDTGSAQIALDAGGDAIAAWVRGNTLVQAALRPAGGVWQTASDVSVAGANTAYPLVALSPQGDALAVWRRYNGTKNIVQSAARAAGGIWQAPVDVSVAGQHADAPQLAEDPQGNAVAVWRRSNGTNYLAQSASRPAGGTWQAPVVLSGTGQDAVEPQIAIDPQGNGVSVWARSDGANLITQGAGLDTAGPQLRTVSIPTSGTTGQPLAFAATPLDVWSAVGATSWTFGDGGTATGTDLTHVYTTPGTFTVSVSTSDILSHATSATRTVTITDAPAPAPAPTPTPPALAAITRLRLSPSTFPAARSGPMVKASAVAKTGTRVSYTLNVAASVRSTIERAGTGRTVGKRCVTPTRSNRKRKACTRYLRVAGSFTRARKPGSDRFMLTGRAGGRTLKPGRYRLRLAPTANGKAGTPQYASFRIVR